MATDESSLITINEDYKNVVLTRTVLAEGRVNAYQMQADANFTSEAFWKKDVLTVEIVSPRGNRIIETYAPAPGGKKLSIGVRIENALSQGLLTLNCVYDRTASAVFSGGETEIQ